MLFIIAFEISDAILNLLPHGNSAKNLFHDTFSILYTSGSTAVLNIPILQKLLTLINNFKCFADGVPDMSLRIRTPSPSLSFEVILPFIYILPTRERVII